MADMKLFLQILANASGLKREMGESGTAVSRFTQGAKREFSSLKGALGGIEGKLAGLGISIGEAKFDGDKEVVKTIEFAAGTRTEE